MGLQQMKDETFSSLGFGIIVPRVNKKDFINKNGLKDLLNVSLSDNDQITIDLSSDPSQLDPLEVQSTMVRIKQSIANFELPFTEKTGASKYRYIPIRVQENSFGKLFPSLGTGSTKRASILFSLIFFNFISAFNLTAKRRINDLSDQGIPFNQSTLICLKCYRNHYNSGMSLTLTSSKELFLHPNWVKYLPEYAGTILFQEIFFMEGNIQEFSQLHSNIRVQTEEAIEWNDTPFTAPISTDGGNFISCGAINVLQLFINRKENSNERLIQVLPAASISNFSESQTAFTIVYNPMLFDAITEQQIPESDTNSSFLMSIPKTGVAEIALQMCVKGKDPKGPKNPKGPKGPRRGPKNKGQGTSQDQGSTDTSRETPQDSDTTLDPLRNQAVIGSEVGKGSHNPKSMAGGNNK
jgi:hypothetical protein